MEVLREYLLTLEATGKFILRDSPRWNEILFRLLRGEDLKACFFRTSDFILDSKSKFQELLFPIELPFPKLFIRYVYDEKVIEHNVKTIGDVYQIVNSRKKGTVVKVEGWPVPRPKFGNTGKAQKNQGIKVVLKQTEFFIPRSVLEK